MNSCTRTLEAAVIVTRLRSHVRRRYAILGAACVSWMPLGHHWANFAPHAVDFTLPCWLLHGRSQAHHMLSKERGRFVVRIKVGTN
jgi:hypothetical protein